MTDAELAIYLKVTAAEVARISPADRATYEQLALTEMGLRMWQEARGQLMKPRGVIVCGERRQRRG